MEKINELLNGTDVYGMNISGHVPLHIKDNVQTGYMYVQTQLLMEILKELKELKELKTEKVEFTVLTKEVSRRVSENNLLIIIQFLKIIFF